MKKIGLLLSLVSVALLGACGGEPASSPESAASNPPSSSEASSPSSSVHEHEYQKAVTDPTCTERGYTTYTCTCGETYIDDYVDALGHDLVHHEAVDPTCTEAGSTAYDTCSRCDYATEPESIDPKGHSYGDWIVDKEATCAEVGSQHKECSVCGDRVEQEIPATGDHDYVAGVCTVCKDVVPDGTTVEFGSYPQTQVTDETLITALSSVEDADGDGYVEYGRNKYLKTLGSGDNGYSTSTTYYFEVEPITWKFYGGMLMAEKVIDASVYYSYSTSSKRTIGDATVYANNYMYSTIRAFLNGYDGTGYSVDNFSGAGFIDKAFTADELSFIKTTTVDNSAATTNSSSNSFACANTTDKIFLLSYQDAINADYGYNTSTSSSDTRVKKYTDYALYRGLEYYNSSTGAGIWWLRSPDSGGSNGARYVYSGGCVYYFYVDYCIGLSPALRIIL